jgi:hypothetical protein
LREQIFSKEFSTTEIYKKLCNDFEVISFESRYDWTTHWDKYHSVTPRQVMGDRNFNKTTFSAVPLYYIGYLLEQKPQAIYDLGCGWNIFKKYIPNVIGVSPEAPDGPKFFGDIFDFVDNDYVKNHQNYFESVFSINALHFYPLSSFSKVVNDFYSMIKSGGRGFLTINLARMIQRDALFADISTKNFELFWRKQLSELNHITPEEIELFCRKELLKLSHIKFLVVDVFSDPLDDRMNGNVRLVMEK